MRFTLAIVLAVMLLGSRPLAAEELRPQLDDLVRHFARVVFGDEYGINTGHKVVAKWQDTVGITVQGRATTALAAMASRRLTDLSRLTKVKFKQVKPGTPGPSLDLMFMKRGEVGKLAAKLPPSDAAAMRKMMKDPSWRCFFLTWNMPSGAIVKSIVVVDVDREPAELDACLLEELTQVMGLPNDVDAYWPTMFKPLDSSLEWSQWDELYLKTLYDPRLKPGMKPVDALQVARGIFAKALAKQP